MGKKLFFKINFSNPVLLYLLIWLTTSYIYKLELTKNIKGLNEKTSLLIHSSCIIFLILYLILVLIRHELKKNKFDIKIKIQNINNDFVITTSRLGSNGKEEEEEEEGLDDKGDAYSNTSTGE